MKLKRFFALFAVLALLLILAVPAFAEETEEPVEEIPAEVPTEEPETADETSEVVAYMKEIAQKLTDTTFWAGLGIDITLVIAVIVFLKKTFDRISVLFKKNGEANKVTFAELKTAFTDEISDTRKLLVTMQERLELSEEQNKKLLAIISILSTNMKGLTASVKAEILALAGDNAPAVENVIETVEKIAEEIREAEAETKEETPALDAIKAETKVNLG